MKISTLSDYDLYLYHQGSNYHSYQLFGAHMLEQDGEIGVRFTVWAPQAQQVSLVGDFNEWNERSHRLAKLVDSGVWTIFVPRLVAGANYKYAIQTLRGNTLLKADPYAFCAELRPDTASVVYDLGKYVWQDKCWQDKKKQQLAKKLPLLIYEVHLGSWQRQADGSFLDYREMAAQLVGYVKDMHYTHIEIMPLCEHPFDGSWGYQTTGYYAVTRRYGEPCDFMYFIDLCHQNDIGVILDWVPGHFCRDEHGLRLFDGTPLYESPDPQLADNIAWGTTNFDYGRPEVQSFLISNALFYCEQYHLDGLRIDAVSNMLYLDYGRADGQWTANEYGGNGNLAAVEFLHKLNQAVLDSYPNVLMIAEESTAWEALSKPVYLGGMGFDFKWNMGWMNDMLRYLALDPIHRKWNHQLLTFSLMYAFSENFVLPLSHDEVVHGKKSLIDKMSGDYWQKFASLRAFLGYWLAHPGKKLLFMGGEFGQFSEWREDSALQWELLEYPMHKQLQYYVSQSNAFYCQHPALWEVDCNWQGFEWIDCNDNDNSIISFLRKGKNPDEFLVVICNFTPVVRYGYRIGVPQMGIYHEVFNSDWAEFGGGDVKNDGDLLSEPIIWHNRQQSLQLMVAPLATIYFQIQRIK